MGLKVFVDFDGTITREDVGNVFFREFGGPACDELVADYRAGKISAKECFQGETAAIGRLPVQQARAFARERSVRPGFRELAAFCRVHAVPVRILSDGLDFYIGEILRAQGLDDIPVSSNILRVGPQDGDGLSPVEVLLPHDDVECARCGCCKRNILVTEAGDEDVIVYVGDGFSDRCPVRYADIVFARGELQTTCQRENISYILYETFFDVKDRLALLLGSGRPRRRNRAAALRKSLFEAEP
jgi:2,3-diketo-5-methylthio-1-phosphopentane phosphatase